MRSNTHNRQDQQKDYRNQSSQQHKSEQNTNSHIFHTAAGAKHASAQKDGQTTTQDKQASNRSSKSTSPTSEQWKRKATFQFSQQLTWKSETGMCMAALIQDRTQHFEYLVNCMQAFLMETGRAQATLANTTLQSDNEQFITNLLKTTALKMGGHMFVRQSPAYSSQSQGSIERFHRTLAGQIRTIRSQLQDNYDRTIKGQQPIMPWMVRHAAYLLNRYHVHSDGNTSFYRRWNKERKAPLCIFGETIQYMAPTAKALPKLEQRFFKGIWLGRDTATNEHIIGITNKVIKQEQ